MVSVLSEVQLERIANYEYSVKCESILDPYFQVYWRWLVEKLPLWLASNTISMIGLVINVATSLLLVWYCPQAKGEAPAWAYFLSAVGLFIYQTLDALDGKQALRTDSDSPLAEVVDHGCDSVSMVVLILATCVATELGAEPVWMFFFSFTGTFMFYSAHWQAYVSGTVRFGAFDVTELQISTIVIFLVTGVFGPQVWTSKVPYLDVQFKSVFFALTIMGTVYRISTILIQIYEGIKSRNGSTIAGTSVLSPLYPIAVVLLMVCVTARTSSTNIFQQCPCLFVLAFGLVCSKITIKLVVCCIARSPVEVLDVVMIGGLLQIVNNCYGSPIDEYLLLRCMLGHVIIEQLRYNLTIGYQICRYLDIKCFSVTKMKIPAKTK